jgi:predicted RNA-binding protein with PUA-like domain
MATKTANYWLVKSEPSAYAWQQLVKDGRTRWEGVRNFAARNNLRAMRNDDLVLYYHSGESKEIVGIAKVVQEAYADPTAKEEDWSAVDLASVKAVTKPVDLGALKAEKKLATMALLRRPRLSVSPVTPEEFALVLELTATKL